MELNRASRGFTLIELLIALVVLSVALAGLIPVLIHTIRGNTFGRVTTQTATYSQDKLEELRRAPFAAVSALLGTTPADTPAAGLTRRWRVRDTCGDCGDVLAIEVCTAETDVADARCFGGTPMASHHFLAVRARF